MWLALTLIFAISGCAIATLLFLKRLEEKSKKQLFLSVLISKGDVRARELSHEAAELYAETKERLYFFATKQLPMRTKSLLSKSESLMKDRAEKLLGNIRNSKFIKRQEGISEFFKNIEIEKGGGEINDSFDAVPEEDTEKLN